VSIIQRPRYSVPCPELFRWLKFSVVTQDDWMVDKYDQARTLFQIRKLIISTQLFCSARALENIKLIIYRSVCAWALSHMRAVRNTFLTFLSSVVASNLTVPLNEVYHIWQCSDVVSNGLGISLNVYRSKSDFPGRSVCEIWGNQFRIPPGLMSFGLLAASVTSNHLKGRTLKKTGLSLVSNYLLTSNGRVWRIPTV